MDTERPIVSVIPGDDAAPEAIDASLLVLEQLAKEVDWRRIAPGTELASLSIQKREDYIRSVIDGSDSVLFGATNGTTPGVIHMRWNRKTFANVRPIRWRPGFQSPLSNPENIDYVIVRENLEDMYVGVMGDAKLLVEHGLTSQRSRIPEGIQDARFAAKIITRKGTERVARFSCDLAMKRGKKLTVSAKTNMLPATDRFFCQIVREVALNYPDLEYEEYIVDDMASRLVQSPSELDVLLLPNLYGDILSDEAAATIGGLGLAPSGCYGDDFAYFESAHGTAPDLSGQNKINPTATLLSAVMLFEYLGLGQLGNRLSSAIDRVYQHGQWLTSDQGGRATTHEFAQAVLDTL